MLTSALSLFSLLYKWFIESFILISSSFNSFLKILSIDNSFLLYLYISKNSETETKLKLNNI